MTATGTGGGDSDYWSAGSRCSDRKQGAGGGRRRAAAAAMRGKWRARMMEGARCNLVLNWREIMDRECRGWVEIWPRKGYVLDVRIN